jgi:hypothetical protein
MTNADRASLAQIMVATLRNHSHLNNVLTHIAAKNWQHVEEALDIILDPAGEVETLTPLAQNILRLICDNRGTTGRIMQPFFLAFLDRAAGEQKERIENRIRRLRAGQPDMADEEAADHAEPLPAFRQTQHPSLTGVAS